MHLKWNLNTFKQQLKHFGFTDNLEINEIIKNYVDFVESKDKFKTKFAKLPKNKQDKFIQCINTALKECGDL
jgi:hypothetical protein